MHAKTIPISIALLALFGAPAFGQLIYVVFKDEKVERRFKDHLTTFKGQRAIVGEPHSGITVQGSNIHYTSGDEAKNAMWVGDPQRPDRVPYEWKKGEKVPARGAKIVRFEGNAVRHFGMVDALQTLEGVATEYRRRVAEIERLAEKRDGFDKAEPSWMNHHGLMLARLDGLESWLSNMGYGKAAKKLRKRIDRERRKVADAVAEREKAALSSIRQVDTPEELELAAEEITGGRYRFRVQESAHIRITYMDEIPDPEVGAALELGERIIEGFRKEFVDPYIDDDFRDYIPDGVFASFYFGPRDKAIHERMGTEYYRIQWDRRKKDRQLSSAGNAFMRGRLGYLAMFQVSGDEARGDDAAPRDLEGILAHRMGHNLADLHFNGGAQNNGQDWLEEAVGYYVSFEFLGRNSLTCFSWDEGSYAKPARKEADKTVQTGLKGFFNELALEQGPSIESLATKKLFEITDADFAKAWSFFDYIAKETGRTGQLWLRDTCAAARHKKGGDFMSHWRKASEARFEVDEGEDVFAVLEKRWRRFAESDQLADD